MSKISELSDGGSLVSSDYLIAVRSGGNVKVRMDQINVDQIDLGDNEFIRLGNSQDLTIVHDASNSIINQAGIGDLLIQKAGSTKLTVNSTGVDITGSATMDGLTVDGGSANNDSGAIAGKFNANGNEHIRLEISTDSTIGNQAALDLVSNSNTSRIYTTGSTGLKFSTDGGTTAHAVIDGSGNVGIGTSSPNGNGILTLNTPTDNSPQIVFSENDTGKWLIGHRHDGDYFRFYDLANSAERMRLDSSGSILFGSTGQGYISGTASNTYNSGYDQDDDSWATWMNYYGYQNGATRYRDFIVGDGKTGRIATFDGSSGNLLVGTTDSTPYDNSANSTADNGIVASAGLFAAARYQGSVGLFNRTGNDGEILGFKRSGAAVGSIGTLNTNRLYFGGADTGIMIASDLDCIYPTNGGDTARDNAVHLGNSGTRFKDLHLSGAANVGNWVAFGGAYNYYVHSDNNNYLRFGSGGSEVARFDSSGTLMVGKTGGSASDDGHQIFGTGQHYYYSTATEVQRFYETTTQNQVGSIAITTSATTYNTSSDYRLKENIVDAPSASDDIDAIQVRSFDWKADGSHQKYGMVAQELQSVAPEAVSGDADSEEMMGVDYSKLVPMMLKEIQSLRARVAQLES